MRILPAQLALLKASLNARFAQHLAEILRAEHPTKVADISPATLQRELLSLIERAHGYGLTLDEDLIAFAELSFVVGRGFDRHPFIHGVLTDETVHPDERMERLFEMAEPEDWREASEIYTLPRSERAA
ncbi:hypothetical protein [Chondromyces crocatus]|uniref:Uncharacterized protein n=1 Tax=Chondromyces crocatus TaxID=52 RepID=A0A0K1E8G6_CHOCO|nr:hypothetical protein [Chondromyces crocatus]AKT36982.1 uncharacterized protein CMC5_011080 [Chondromyces crocatus]